MSWCCSIGVQDPLGRVTVVHVLEGQLARNRAWGMGGGGGPMDRVRWGGVLAQCLG